MTLYLHSHHHLFEASMRLGRNRSVQFQKKNTEKTSVMTLPLCNIIIPKLAGQTIGAKQSTTGKYKRISIKIKLNKIKIFRFGSSGFSRFHQTSVNVILLLSTYSAMDTRTLTQLRKPRRVPTGRATFFQVSHRDCRFSFTMAESRVFRKIMETLVLSFN
ncbi:hypothetical protein BDV37DRAFT_111823 [Aspergillus pseudonomiae]|uniref:Uncharacterized protein n=1 Tax=Aspergillus pseudonomiae TaxID=1506151 RepID=A0A5N7DTG6_9EURO|nr:uncharacterized protein BDV37DRAFT_111823 [Aspergillus pseudonomiae]KAE8409343.1 hypothetical protein BDV37DRAFT_111823 [Aspergillus pseudonomiae]